MKKYLAILLLFSSCVNADFFEENKPINNRAWEYSNKHSFAVKIDDNKAKYDVYINVRHSSDYDFSNLFVLLHQKGKGLTDTAFRKEISLAELDGRWKGKSAGGLYETQLLAHQNFSFPDTGTYTFSLEQNMRVNPLPHISDVGIKIIKK